MEKVGLIYIQLSIKACIFCRKLLQEVFHGGMSQNIKYCAAKRFRLKNLFAGDKLDPFLLERGIDYL